MGQTTIATGNAQTKKAFAGALFDDAIFGSYWGSTFMAAGSKNRTPNSPMQLVTDLEKDDGDTVNYDLYVQLKASLLPCNNIPLSSVIKTPTGNC